MNTKIDHRWASKWDFLKDQGLSIFSLLLVLLLAAGAFALSYAGLKDLASKNGVDPGLVWIWPLILDGAIVVFSVCAFRAGLCGESIAYPMFLVVLSTLASIAFNVLHAPIPDDATFWSKAALIPRIMASIPPLALFLSFEVMIRQLQSQVQGPNYSRHSSGYTAEQLPMPFGNGLGNELGLPEEAAYTAKANRPEPRQKVVENPIAAAMSSSSLSSSSSTGNSNNGRPSAKATAEAKALVIQMCKQGALIEDMAEASGRSPRTVTRYLNEAGLAVPMAGSRGWKKPA